MSIALQALCIVLLPLLVVSFACFVFGGWGKVKHIQQPDRYFVEIFEHGGTTFYRVMCKGQTTTFPVCTYRTLEEAEACILRWSPKKTNQEIKIDKILTADVIDGKVIFTETRGIEQ